MYEINDGSKMALRDRYSSAYVHNHSVLISVEVDGPCPFLLCCHILLPLLHGSSHTNRDPLYFCQHIHSSRNNHSHSSATWCTCASRRSCTSSLGSHPEWGSQPSSQRKGCSSTFHYQSDLSSSRCSLEGIPARVGWSSFVVKPSPARGVRPGLCLILNSCMLVVGARKSTLGIGRFGGTALS